jgi:hypothetical protein
MILLCLFNLLADNKESAVNFTQLEEIIKNDKLDKELVQKNKILEAIKKKQKLIEGKKYFYPPKEQFVSMLSDLWLVQNAILLKWDFEHADLGITAKFSKLMENMGYQKKQITLLLSDSTSVFHLSLPTRSSHFYLLLSLPFIQSMNLTTSEIATLLFEEVIRFESNELSNTLSSDPVWQLAGQQMKDQKPNVNLINQYLSTMSNQLLTKGYTFQQQYEVTQKVRQLLKTNAVYYAAYISLLKKKVELVKNNKEFKQYTALYPSPEMQLQWINEGNGILLKSNVKKI